MIYVGIDPGLSGAVAAIDERGHVIVVADTPTTESGGKRHYDIDKMAQMLRFVSEARVILEHVQAMPGQGVTSMFRFGEGFGIWQGILGALGLTHALVRPQTWTKAMLSGEAKGDMRGLLAARRRWPKASLARKKDDGRADALWLAEYGRAHHWRQP